MDKSETSTMNTEFEKPDATVADTNPKADPSTTTAPAFSAPKSSIKYNMYYTTSMCNVTFHQGEKDSPVIFYAQSKLLKSRPIFQIREGSDKGRIISTVQVPWLKRTMHVGLGEDTDEALIRDKNTWHRSDYHFTFEKDYDWLKRPACASTAYDCLDKDGISYASMLSGGAFNWSKAGEFWAAEGVTGDLLAMLLASSIGIWTLEGLNYQSFFKSYE